MRRLHRIERRRAIYVGVEGDSDRALAGFLQWCCDEAGLRVHLDIRPGTGGDSYAVVEHARRRLERHAGRKEFQHTLVLLDRDRVEQDRVAGRDAPALAARARFEIVYQEPNLEGLLVRLHGNQEQRRVAATSAEGELRRLWPQYRKPPTVEQLKQRFKLEDVRRAAQYDQELRKLLDILGL